MRDAAGYDAAMAGTGRGEGSDGLPAWAAAGLLAALVLLPGLGAVGLVDPWETHYAEVARRMVAGGDWVHPRWRDAFFFSKPPLVLWGAAAGLALLGPGLVEWAVRLPVALLSVALVAFSAAAVERLAGRRAGLLAGVALATTPFLVLFGRQLVPDAPLALLTTGALLAFAVGMLDPRAGPGFGRGGWVLLALAVLAKGPMGLLFPAAALGAWALVTGGWGRLRRVLLEPVGGRDLPAGPLLFLALAVPWYAAMALFPGRDESGLTFLERFFLHDHLRRVLVGVHAPVPGGGALAYLGWIGVGTFPWVAGIPGGIAMAVRARRMGWRDRPGDALALLLALAGLAGWGMAALTATRYPHYVLPAAAPLVVLAALFLDRLVEEGLRRHAVAAALGFAAVAVAGTALARRPRLVAALFTYDPRRPWPAALFTGPATVLTTLAAAVVLGLAVSALLRSARAATLVVAGVALVSAAWISHVHWRELAPQRTQREVFALLRAAGARPEEPVVAWRMRWRGEVFYGGEGVLDVIDRGRMQELAARPGRIWVVTEAERLESLEGTVADARRVRVVEPVSGRYRLVELTDRAAPP